MKRFVKVRGVPGSLVANPHVPGSMRRFAGMKRRPEKPEDRGVEMNFVDRFEPVDEVLEDHSHLRAAIAAGELVKLGEAHAKSVDSAKFEAPAAPKKKGE